MIKQSRLAILSAASLIAGINLTDLIGSKTDREKSPKMLLRDDSEQIRIAAEKRHRKQLRRQALLKKEQLLSQLD